MRSPGRRSHELFMSAYISPFLKALNMATGCVFRLEQTVNEFNVKQCF